MARTNPVEVRVVRDAHKDRREDRFIPVPPGWLVAIGWHVPSAKPSEWREITFPVVGWVERYNDEAYQWTSEPAIWRDGYLQSALDRVKGRRYWNVVVGTEDDPPMAPPTY